ncbi:MAG: TetR/AcrR family transcriptional regulator [Hyphomonas sp.]|nr:TetR/AcrR family transcriptional regulator [Hyphomonas sp.]
MPENSPETESRQDRRKRLTRRSLIDAAMKVFSEKSVEDTTVRDITETADVAYGTFYNYFDSVEDIVPDVALEMLSAHGRSVAEIAQSFDDVASIAAINVRALFIRILPDATLKWLAGRPHSMVSALEAVLTDHSTATVQRGVEEGRFKLVGSRENMRSLLLWGFVGLWDKAWKSGGDYKQVVDDVSLMYLRILGLTDEDAVEVLAKLPEPYKY